MNKGVAVLPFLLSLRLVASIFREIAKRPTLNTLSGTTIEFRGGGSTLFIEPTARTSNIERDSSDHPTSTHPPGPQTNKGVAVLPFLLSLRLVASKFREIAKPSTLNTSSGTSNEFRGGGSHLFIEATARTSNIERDSSDHHLPHTLRDLK